MAALAPGGVVNDTRPSIVYYEATGEIDVDVPVDVQLMFIGITSETHLFADGICINGSYDNCKEILFRAAFATSFGSFSFGEVAPPGLSEKFLESDLTARSGLLGGGELVEFDLVYIPVPEPATTLLLCLGLLPAIFHRRAFLTTLVFAIPVFLPLALYSPSYGRSFAALAPGGLQRDDRHSIIYDAATGDLAVDVPDGRELTAVQIESGVGIFTRTLSPDFRCGGSDCEPTEHYIFIFTFPLQPPFASLDIGPIATAGLSEEFIVSDLTVIGSTYRFDDIPGVPLDSDDFDLIYIPVPEPATVLLVCAGLCTLGLLRRPLNPA